ncbi:hypothetical protein [Arthrobacter sp. NPDC058127]|uniref:hypothetical protein n=1 Tax=Arthrobacter sp. NPDC058127 TaxID=3346351 RepID=UPI0036E31FAC
MEIDHILPRQGFQAALALFNMPPSHSLDGLENLAPICAAGSKCNQRKGNAVKERSGAIEDALERALKLSAPINADIERMRTAQGFESALVKALTENPEIQRRSLTNYGPLLAKRIRAIDERLLENFESTVILSPNIDNGYIPDFMVDGWTDDLDLVLDSTGRFALRVAKEILKLDLVEVISGSLESMVGELDEKVEEIGFVDDADLTGFSLVGPRHISLGSLNAKFGTGAILEVSVEGHISCEQNSPFTSTNVDGLLLDGNSTVSVDGSFTVRLVFGSVDDDPEIEFDLDKILITRI